MIGQQSRKSSPFPSGLGMRLCMRRRDWPCLEQGG